MFVCVVYKFTNRSDVRNKGVILSLGDVELKSIELTCHPFQHNSCKLFSKQCIIIYVGKYTQTHLFEYISCRYDDNKLEKVQLHYNIQYTMITQFKHVHNPHLSASCSISDLPSAVEGERG